MFYVLFGLIVMVIILFITANTQVSSYSANNFESFTLSSVGNIRDKIKSPIRSNIISTIKHRMNKNKEIEDVQLVDNADIYQYLD